jgi:hypothetical protein
LYETKFKLNFAKFDYNNKTYKSLSFSKKDLSIYKNESLVSDKSNENLKDTFFVISNITSYVYIIQQNKIFLIKNSFNNQHDEDFEVMEKITKHNQIQQAIIVDPYMFMYLDNKVYIYCILDLNKCLEVYDLELPSINYNLTNVYYRDINLLMKLNKLNLEDGVIQYNDSLHLNRIKKIKDFEYILNSARYVVGLFNNKSNKIEWLHSTDFDENINMLTRLNQDFTNKFLKYLLSFSNNNLQINNICKQNKDFLLHKTLSMFYYLISINEYNRAKTFQEETQTDYIFVMYLLKNFILSTNIQNLLSYLVRNLTNLFEGSFYEEHIKSVILKSEKEVANFLKTFFNKIIIYRNDIKVKLDKTKRKELDINSVINSINDNSVEEDILRYIIVENVIFISHFYSYKFSKSSKYTDNLKTIIKISHNILDKELINMLKEQHLEEEILLFYFHKGNYAKCISNIISIYDNIDSETKISSDIDKELNIKLEDLNTNDLSGVKTIDKVKSQWLSRYINLISVISDKISPIEFNEYIKWALSRNAFKTIDILFENKKISKEKLDIDFINLLNGFGIDPVIYYLKTFIKNNPNDNPSHHNEMINLYIIKMKLLVEALEKETTDQVKWNKKILSKSLINLETREEYCNFLIDNKYYNLSYAFEKSAALQLDLELGIILVKQNKLEEAVPKMLNSQFPSKTKLIKKILKVYPDYDLIYLIIKFIINNTQDNDEKEAAVLDILEVIKERYDLIYVYMVFIIGYFMS